MVQLNRKHAALVALLVIGAVLFAPLASAVDGDDVTTVDDSATGTATASADETSDTPLRHHEGCDETTATDEDDITSTPTDSA